jgi:hypothetical protein
MKRVSRQNFNVDIFEDIVPKIVCKIILDTKEHTKSIENLYI